MTDEETRSGALRPSASLPGDVALRRGNPEDRVGVRRVLDAAFLEVDDIAERLSAGDVLVAVADGGNDDSDDRVLGAIVLDPDGPPGASADADGGDPTEPSGANGDADGDDRVPSDAIDVEDATYVTAVAVLRGRRGRGIGSALAEAALDCEGRLVADFDPSVRPFYETLEFAIVETDGRCWGLREA